MSSSFQLVAHDRFVGRGHCNIKTKKIMTSNTSCKEKKADIIKGKLKFRLTKIEFSTFILAFFFLTPFCLAQLSLKWLDPLPQGNNFNKIKKISGDTLVAVGDCGTIVRIYGQNNRQIISVPTKANLNDVDFKTSKLGVVCGDSGTILITSNSGLTWNKLPFSSGFGNTNLTSARFVHDGIIVGNTAPDGGLFKTTNNITWSSSFNSVFPIQSIDFINSKNGILCGSSGLIYRTSNGGNSWTNISYNSSESFTDAKMIDTLNFIVVGTKILRTSNGGQTWSLRNSSITGILNRLILKNQNEAIAISNDQYIYSSDGGYFWNAYPRVMNYSASFINNLLYHANGPEIQFSSNLGISWNSVLSKQRLLGEIRFFNSRKIISIGKDSIFRSNDAGKTWKSVVENTLGLSEFTILPSGSIIASSNITTSTCGIYKSIDSGLTFQNILTFNQPGVSSIDFVDNNTGYISAYERIYKTVNGGTSWNSYLFSGPFSNAVFYDVSALSTGEAVAISENKIFRLSSSGISQITSPAGSSNFVCLDFCDQNNGIILCKSGKVLRTNNGGNNWTVEESPTNLNFTSVCFLNPSKVFAGTQNGSIFYSENGAVSWKMFPKITNDYINYCNFARYNFGFFGLGNSSILIADSTFSDCSFDGTISASQEINCVNLNATLTAGGGTSFLWSNGSTNPSITVNPLSTTTFSVIITNSQGCKDTLYQQVIVDNSPPAVPLISFQGSLTICEGTTKTLTSSSNSGNQWFKDGSALSGQTGPNLNATLAGAYSVKVTGTNGCTSTSSIVNLVITSSPPVPTITPSGPTTFCAGGGVTLQSSSASGNQWYNGNTPLVGQIGQTFLATNTGSYSTKVSNAFDCESQSTPVGVQANTRPQITQDPNDAAIENNQTATFVTKCLPTNATFKWQTDLGSGFGNVFNTGQYSGANQDTLKVNNVTSANQNQKFRCIASLASCFDTSTVSVLTVLTSISDELNSKEHPIIFPNPTNGSFYVKGIGSTYSVRLLSVSGLEIARFQPAPMFDLTGLPKGYYIMEINTQDGRWYKNLILN
jgi:photosystem II stability/assembly factor-like uncharacterized protein